MPLRPEPLTRSARKCLVDVLLAESEGEPLNATSYRARNSNRIADLDALSRKGLPQTESDRYTLTFLGLLILRTRKAAAVRRQCAAIFKAIAGHYRQRPHEAIQISILATEASLSTTEAIEALRFLARSPASLGSGPSNLTAESSVRANEHYVTLRSFEGLTEFTHRLQAQPPLGGRNLLPGVSPLALDVLPPYLLGSGNEEIRAAWERATERVGQDYEAAITAAKALVEATCKHILEEQGQPVETSDTLPQLYKRAAAQLSLAPEKQVAERLRGLLGGCAAIVTGVSELRNLLSDSHGKGRSSPRPAKRHAELAVVTAGAISAFLLATLDAQRVP